MDSRTRHPRLLAVLRTILYLSAAVATTILLGITFSFLALIVVFSTAMLLLVGESSVIVVAGGLGLLASGLVAYTLVGTTRRVDRYLMRIAQAPSPLEQVKRQYVEGRIDEGGLERGLERILTAELHSCETLHSRKRSSRSLGTTRPASIVEVEISEETR